MDTFKRNRLNEWCMKQFGCSYSETTDEQQDWADIWWEGVQQ